MNKYTLACLLFTFPGFIAFSQINFSYQHVDSLQKSLAKEKHDSSRVLTLAHLSEAFRWSNSDSAKMYGQEALNLANTIRFPKGQASALTSLSVVNRELGNLPEALDYALKSLEIAQANKLPDEESLALMRMANVYSASGNIRKALFYMNKTEAKAVESGNKLIEMIAQWLQADLYNQLNQFDSSRYFIKLAQKTNYVEVGDAFHYSILGDLELRMKHDSAALMNYHAGLKSAIAANDVRTLANLYNGIASYYADRNHPDSAVYYAQKGLRAAEQLSYKNRIMTAANILATIYERSDPVAALKYYKIFAAAKDTLFSVRKMQAVQGMLLDEQERKNEVEKMRGKEENQRNLFLLLGAIAIFAVIIIILYRSNKQKHNANRLLQKQKKALDKEKQKVEQSLVNLNAAQSQLIQSEKMASLGELTAGIAHEIQNPLNFVNNFSEVSAELLDEMEDALLKSDREEILSIAADIKSNLEKINHHGKRADAIVKGMLQHSQSSTGKKEPTDINALCDEYLRLSYHGLRAKDKRFNADFKTDFDDSLENINIVPQDIGRVILNLLTNAFYAVNEKNKLNIPGYQPTVTVSTSRSFLPGFSPSPSGRAGVGSGVGCEVHIKVTDNGNGIPQKVLDKIFQPFFTTKPTGQGTGLGLSLSYDIVKAHGGELKVETLSVPARAGLSDEAAAQAGKEARQPAQSDHPGVDDPVGRGEGTTFIIQLPI
ncbi:MAG: ATP-binding protein [Ferruginibacter sp.]